MNDDARDLVSALLAIAYAAVLLVVGELYITSRCIGSGARKASSPAAVMRYVPGLTPRSSQPFASVSSAAPSAQVLSPSVPCALAD